MIAPGANLGNFNVAGRYAGLAELLVAELPKIKIGWFGLKGGKGGREFVLIVAEFSTTGAKGWTDPRQEVSWLAGKGLGHSPDSFGDDVLHITTPAHMDIGHRTADRIIKKYGLTIRLLDE